MQVSNRNHKPHCLRTLNGSCEGGEGPLRLLPHLASPPGMSAVGSRGRAGWDSDPHCSLPACGVCPGKLTNWIIGSESIRPGPGAGRSQARRLTLWTGRGVGGGWRAGPYPPLGPLSRETDSSHPALGISGAGSITCRNQSPWLGAGGILRGWWEEWRRKREGGDPHLPGCGLPQPLSKPCKSLERLNFQPLKAGDTEARREYAHCSRSDSPPSGGAQGPEHRSGP